MTEQATHGNGVERWWPGLSIDAKHRVLAAIEGAGDAEEVELDEVVSAEISERVGGSAATPVRLSRKDCDYIRTQVEAVD
ncbi:hypothetical protein ABIQ69_15575 [Agromyces sp. G08B096]|uniref:Uncharacterized protein n=1 Tax=Agromyces sp. G08B096 TaxID=3156399 RepID=A0AAU7W6C6_9MICO